MHSRNRKLWAPHKIEPPPVHVLVMTGSPKGSRKDMSSGALNPLHSRDALLQLPPNAVRRQSVGDRDDKGQLLALDNSRDRPVVSEATV